MNKIHFSIKARPAGIAARDGDRFFGARRAALAEAGLAEAAVRDLRCAEFVFLGRRFYEVTFTTDELRCEYHVDAETGQVAGRDFTPSAQ